jgi:hypothetical protein
MLIDAAKIAPRKAVYLEAYCIDHMAPDRRTNPVSTEIRPGVSKPVSNWHRGQAKTAEIQTWSSLISNCTSSLVIHRGQRSVLIAKKRSFMAISPQCERERDGKQ